MNTIDKRSESDIETLYGECPIINREEENLLNTVFYNLHQTAKELYGTIQETINEKDKLHNTQHYKSTH